MAIPIALNVGPAADMALNQAFRFELGVRIGDRRPVDTQNRGQFTAGRYTIAGPQIARMHQRAQLISQLDVQGNVAFRLKVYRKHCLPPGTNFSKHWPNARAILSFATSRTSFRELQWLVPSFLASKARCPRACSLNRTPAPEICQPAWRRCFAQQVQRLEFLADSWFTPRILVLRHRSGLGLRVLRLLPSPQRQRAQYRPVRV